MATLYHNVGIDVSKTTVRAAELATILRFSGGLHLISGRIAVESELDTSQLARRVRKDLAELYGVKSEISVISASAHSSFSRSFSRSRKAVNGVA